LDPGVPPERAPLSQAQAERSFWDWVADKPRLLQEGHKAGRDAAPDRLPADGLLFSGMGFSGVGANLVADAATRSLDMPLSIVKHYQFPQHVRKGWHTLAVSYSGETEETLSVVRESLKRGVPVTAFTTGGTLASTVDRIVPQPPGYQPRAALAYTWMSLLGFLEGSGLLRDAVPLKEAVAAVQEVGKICGPAATGKNPAKALADAIWDKIPQIYATPSFYGVGLHFRGMLNENAKKIADVDMVPECNHNDLTGWGGDAMFRHHFAVVELSHAEQNPQMRRRLDYMRKLYEGWGIAWHAQVSKPIHGFGEHVVEQARALHFLDYVSLYVAQRKGVDPKDIKEIVGLKAYLAGRAEGD
jgi:glucose/mannose-6-phosphate isomerase